MEKIKLASHNECTGCAACSDVCPKKCIDFYRPQDSLHKFPRINREECIECGLCMKSCPVISSDSGQEDYQQSYYAAWNNDEEQVKTSTSGGIGASLTDWAFANGYVVCGSSFNEDWFLSHNISESPTQAEKFKRSKYLQSETTGVFKGILDLLKRNKKVLFIGTPCQIAGLKKVCERFKHNLVTVDIICHGVNSPYVWSQYVDYLENRFGSRLIDYNFRDKSHGWERKTGSENLRVSMNFSNGKSINERAVYNQFHYWFGQHFILREACFNCIYRTENRISDITIGDFWGIDKIMQDVDITSGVSVVVANTNVGQSIIDKLNIVKTKIDAIDALKVLKGYIEKRSQSVRDNDVAKMKTFTHFYLANTFNDSILRFKAPTRLQFFIQRIKSFLHI